VIRETSISIENAASIFPYFHCNAFEHVRQWFIPKIPLFNSSKACFLQVKSAENRSQFRSNQPESVFPFACSKFPFHRVALCRILPSLTFSVDLVRQHSSPTWPQIPHLLGLSRARSHMRLTNAYDPIFNATALLLSLLVVILYKKSGTIDILSQISCKQ
jgi:hypothetical protein